MITLHRIMNYNTRNAKKLHVRYRRTNFIKHTISNNGVITWNILLDNKLANITSYSTFKKIKNILPRVYLIAIN